MKRMVAAILLVVCCIALIGARGDTKKEVGDEYINDIKAVATGVVGFHKTQSGDAASTATTQRVHFLDVYNSTDSLVTLQIIGPNRFSTAYFVAYVPSGMVRSFDGYPVDSINIVTAGAIGATEDSTVFLTGLGAR